MGMTLHAATEYDAGNSGATKTIAWASSVFQKLTLTDNCVLTFTAPQGAVVVTLKLIQDGTGSRTVTWPGTVIGPTILLSTTVAAVDTVRFYYDGTNYRLIDFIQGDGNVYIAKVAVGTAVVPASKLEVIDTVASPVLTITNKSDTNTYDPKIVLRSGASPATRWELGFDDSDSDRLIISPLLADTYPVLSMLTTGKTKFQILDNDTESFQIKQATNAYITIDTTNDAEKVVMGKNLEVGLMVIDDNSGAVNFVDMAVTATAPASTEESLSIAIDGNVIIKAYAESNGSGGIQNQKALVGTATILTENNVLTYDENILCYEGNVLVYV